MVVVYKNMVGLVWHAEWLWNIISAKHYYKVADPCFKPFENETQLHVYKQFQAFRGFLQKVSLILKQNVTHTRSSTTQVTRAVHADERATAFHYSMVVMTWTESCSKPFVNRYKYGDGVMTAQHASKCLNGHPGRRWQSQVGPKHQGRMWTQHL